MVKKYFKDFCWTSIQINVNTVSSKHTDKNNVGLSIMFVLGLFSKGEFRSSDQDCPIVKAGEAVVFDGKYKHWSDPFLHSDRVSIVFFQHDSAKDLSMKDKCVLDNMGFLRTPKPLARGASVALSKVDFGVLHIGNVKNMMSLSIF